MLNTCEGVQMHNSSMPYVALHERWTKTLPGPSAYSTTRVLYPAVTAHYIIVLAQRPSYNMLLLSICERHSCNYTAASIKIREHTDVQTRGRVISNKEFSFLHAITTVYGPATSQPLSLCFWHQPKSFLQNQRLCFFLQEGPAF